MASTILAQILENVGNGALLPLEAEPPPKPRQTDLEELLVQAEKVILEEIDRELETLFDRLEQLPGLQCLASAPASVREEICQELADVATEAISGTSRRRRQQTTPVSPPAPSDGELSSHELRELLRPLRDLPSVIDERLNVGSSSEVLKQLGRLSREVQELANRQLTSQPLVSDRSATPPADPPGEAQPKVPLDDIQKMIDFLK